MPAREGDCHLPCVARARGGRCGGARIDAAGASQNPEGCKHRSRSGAYGDHAAALGQMRRRSYRARPALRDRSFVSRSGLAAGDRKGDERVPRLRDGARVFCDAVRGCYRQPHRSAGTAIAGPGGPVDRQRGCGSPARCERPVLGHGTRDTTVPRRSGAEPWVERIRVGSSRAPFDSTRAQRGGNRDRDDPGLVDGDRLPGSEPYLASGRRVSSLRV